MNTNEFRQAIRSIIGSPSFTISVVSTLALGIGAVTSVFTVVDRVLFQGLPFPEPTQLVALGYKSKQYGFIQGTLPIELAAYRERTSSFSNLSALSITYANLVVGDDPHGISVGRAEPGYFETFGVAPALGRLFSPAEVQTSESVIILSNPCWRELFRSASDIIGRRVSLGDSTFTIIGVLPAAFSPPGMPLPQVYQPVHVPVDPAKPMVSTVMYVVARMKPSATLDKATSEIRTITVDVGPQFSSFFADRVPTLRALAVLKAGDQRLAQWLVLISVGFLYVVGCLNASHLVLVRLHKRRRELTIRLSLGATFWGLTRLVLAEILILVAAASVAGVVIAAWTSPSLFWVVTGRWEIDTNGLSRWLPVLLTASLSVAALTLIGVGGISKVIHGELSEGLKEGAHTVGENRRFKRVREILLVSEAIAAFVLVVGANLMSRTVHQLQTFDRGLDPKNKAALTLFSVPSKYRGGPEARALFTQSLEKQLRAVPGILDVSFASVVPFSHASSSLILTKRDGTKVSVETVGVAPHYQEMLGLTLLRGAWFDETQGRGLAVVVLSESAARELFNTEDPLGQYLSLDGGRGLAPPWLVVGIAHDVSSNVRERSRPQIYFPERQLQSTAKGAPMILLKLSRAPDPLMNELIRRAIYRVDPLIATMPLEPFSDMIEYQISRERYTLAIFRIVSVLSLGLAGLGVLSVTSYSISQRLGEFGIRMICGGMPSQIAIAVMRNSVLLAAVAVVIGSGISFVLTLGMRHLLFETPLYDPIAYCISAGVIIVVSIIGSLLPTIRVMRMPLANLLRSE